MKKHVMLAAALMLCAFMLAGCSAGSKSGVTYTVAAEARSAAQAQPETVTAEMTGRPVQLAQPQEATVVFTPAPTMASEYAGATPVIIYPIDRPTPTPLPALNFEYETYDATRLHLSFEAPVGWRIDESQDGVYVLTDPATNVDYQAAIVVSTVKLTSDYSESQMKAEVTNRLSAKKNSYYSFSSTKTASRTLLDKAGVYADYSATLSSGVKIKGRIHVTCVNKTLYVFEMVTPEGYFNTYKDSVYTKFRHTLKITQ